MAVKHFLDSEAGKNVQHQLQDWLGEGQELLTDKARKIDMDVAVIPNMD